MEKLKQHLLRGNIMKLKESMKKQLNFLNKQQFDDSFKGVFGLHVYNEKDIRATRTLIKDIIDIMRD